MGIWFFTSSIGEDGDADCGRDSGYRQSKSGLNGNAIPTRFISGVKFSGGTFILYRKRRLVTWKWKKTEIRRRTGR